MSEDYQDLTKDEGESSFDALLGNQSSRVIGAVVLIGLGVVFLLSQFDVLNLSGNWWALFIAIPAAVMLFRAYSIYSRVGHYSDEVRKNLTGGLIVATVAIIAFTNQWGRLWPLFLIVPGALMLLGRNNEKAKRDESVEVE